MKEGSKTNCPQKKSAPTTMKTMGYLKDVNIVTDLHFTKIWWKKQKERKPHQTDDILDFAKVLATIGNEKINVLIVLIDNVKMSTNEIDLSQREIRERVSSFTGKTISLQTVSVTMKSLAKIGFIKLIGPGHYMLNPDVLFRGSYKIRPDVINKFGDKKIDKSFLPGGAEARPSYDNGQSKDTNKFGEEIPF